MKVGPTKLWLRRCAIGLFISACGLGLGYALFGHMIVDRLYAGTTGTFLDAIIIGQHIHPIEHYHTIAGQRVLKVSIALGLFAWGLLGFSIASSTWLLVLFLATDLLFIILEYLYGATAGFPASDFWLGKDWGYAETFQYAKELGIVVVFCLFALRHPHLISLGWQVLFLYLLLDDSLQIHERLGKAIARHAHISWVFTDHAASVVFGSLIVSLLSVGYYCAPPPLRRVSRDLLGLFIILVLFGVFLDTVHQVLWGAWPHLTRWGYIVEEAGELVTISVFAWYVHRLTTKGLCHFPQAVG
jgi:hypothetical protein